MSEKRIYGVVTTIQAPTECMVELAEKWPGDNESLIIVGDSKGPFDYDLKKSRLYSIDQQRDSNWSLSKILPEKHYARKNLGYLEAFKSGAEVIYETDDDNQPLDTWEVRERRCISKTVKQQGWINVYSSFSNEIVWPRGLSLDAIGREAGTNVSEATWKESPIQQGLADGAPDVDAIWRLVMDREFHFESGPSLSLQRNAWCPFNSQTTWWWPEAYPLMYLPSYCPFRMTDIWRSFVAQRCLWELGFELVFHESEAFQLRNPHDPMSDFRDEVSGYLRNDEIRRTLEDLQLKSGSEHLFENLMRCYKSLVKIDLLPEKELRLVEAWIEDCKKFL